MSSGQVMLAEMREQPQVLAALAQRRSEIISRVSDVIAVPPVGTILVARGSSDHAAIFGRYVIELASRRPAFLAAPSLYTLYRAETELEGYVAVAASQSGRTPEIVTVLERLMADGAVSIGITNDETSPLAASATVSVGLGAGAEKAVPATKTFTAQLAVTQIIAEAMGEPLADAHWEALPQVVAAILEDSSRSAEIAESIGESPALVSVGRGFQFAVAMETALKLKETSGIAAEGYSAADLRHGPIAAVGEGFPVLVTASRGPAAADAHALADELRNRGGRVWVIGDVEGADLPIPEGLPEQLATVATAVRGQQLARELALVRGINPDEPLGLSKVTETH